MPRLFGTDGIRGRFGIHPFLPQEVVSLGRAVGIWLNRKYHPSRAQTQTQKAAPHILIAKDTRSSCGPIITNFLQGLNQEGLCAICLGVIPTPGLAYLTKELNADLGVMVSASHNLAMDNGIKLFDSRGMKLKPLQEEQIEEILFEEPVAPKNHQPPFPPTEEQLSPYDLCEKYFNFLKGIASGLDLKGLRMVIDCANGAVSEFAPRLFSELGARVYTLYNEPNGLNINFYCGSLYPGDMAVETRRRGACVGFSFDGDGDRLIVADEKGRILDGDYIMAMLGLDFLKQNKLPKNTVVATVMSNFGLEKLFEKWGITLKRTKVGDRFVLEKMLRGGYRFGGEQSGHIIFLDKSITGDGMITAIELLKLIQRRDMPLSELARCLYKYPQILVNVKVRKKIPLKEIPGLFSLIREHRKVLGDAGRILVRYSGTEPLVRIMVEGRVYEDIERMATSIAELIQENLD